MPKECLEDNCTRNSWGGGYCDRHQYLRTDKKKAKIKQYSSKRDQINRHSYSPRMRAFIKQKPFCELKITGVCSKVSQGVHHIKGKATIELLLDESFWMASCNNCNSWVEGNTKKSVEMGLKIPDYSSKLTGIKPRFDD